MKIQPAAGRLNATRIEHCYQAGFWRDEVVGDLVVEAGHSRTIRTAQLAYRGEKRFELGGQTLFVFRFGLGLSFFSALFQALGITGLVALGHCLFLGELEQREADGILAPACRCIRGIVNITARHAPFERAHLPGAPGIFSRARAIRHTRRLPCLA